MTVQIHSAQGEGQALPRFLTAEFGGRDACLGIIVGCSPVEQ